MYAKGYGRLGKIRHMFVTAHFTSLLSTQMRPGNLTLQFFEDVLRQVSTIIFSFVTTSDSSGFLLLVPLCFTALAVSLLLFRRFVSNPGSSGTPPELSALQKIIVPTSSRWSLSSRQLVACSRVSSHRTIWLSLDALVQRIVSGDIELRHPPRDLPDLLCGSLLVDGWDVRLCVHLLHRIHAILWTILARFFDVSYERGHVVTTADALKARDGVR